jgi:hypothetical protein
MKRYSATTEKRFIAIVAQTAINVEAVAIEEIARGPSNLQRRSMRRIRALRAEVNGQQEGKLHVRRAGRLTSASRLVPFCDDDNPVSLHRDKVHH